MVNATTLAMGGAVQIGVSLLEYAAAHPMPRLRVVYAASEAVAAGLSADVKKALALEVTRVSASRAWSGRPVRHRLLALEQKAGVHLVYSAGFPSYVRFRVAEVGRYTNPWEMLPNPLALATIPWRARPRLAARTAYRRAWARRATWFETQTEAGRDGIARHLGVPRERIRVFPNAPNPRFLAADTSARAAGADRRILCLSAAHPHKNLGMVPRVARVLAAQPDAPRYRFVLTLPADSRLWRTIEDEARAASVSSAIENVGPLSLAECVAAYADADAVFLPTLLEVFSATYVEAMAMRRPIVTSDLGFARATCGEAALYHDPLSPVAAAEALRRVCEDETARLVLLEHGRRQLARFPSADEKHRQLFEWLQDLAEREAANDR